MPFAFHSRGIDNDLPSFRLPASHPLTPLSTLTVQVLSLSFLPFIILSFDLSGVHPSLPGGGRPS